MRQDENSGIGDRLRSARKSKGLSLQVVAEEAGVSAATLSRIETSKQAIDLALFLRLTRILQCNAGDVIGEDERSRETELAQKIGSLQSPERLRLWTQLAEGARGDRRDPKGRRRVLAAQVDELLAQLDLVREEVEALRRALLQI